MVAHYVRQPICTLYCHRCQTDHCFDSVLSINVAFNILCNLLVCQPRVTISSFSGVPLPQHLVRNQWKWIFIRRCRFGCRFSVLSPFLLSLAPFSPLARYFFFFFVHKIWLPDIICVVFFLCRFWACSLMHVLSFVDGETERESCIQTWTDGTHTHTECGKYSAPMDGLFIVVDSRIVYARNENVRIHTDSHPVRMAQGKMCDAHSVLSHNFRLSFNHLAKNKIAIYNR